MANMLPRRSDSGVYGGRVTAFLLLSSAVAASGGLLFGYDVGITGGVISLDSFLRRFFPEVVAKMSDKSTASNYCRFDSQLLTAFTSSLYIAGLVASFFASSVTTAFGRKSSMLIGGAVFLAGAAVCGAAVNVFMLILGRLMLGVGIGFTNQSIPLYLSELAPPKHRGAINNFFEICIGSGILFANLTNYGAQKIKSGWGWRLSLSLAAFPSAILFLGAFFLPETPSSSIQRSGDIHKATLLLQKLRGSNNVQQELDDLITASTAIVAKSHQHQFRTISQRRYRPHLVMAIAIPFFQGLTGIGVISFYSPILFRTIGFRESASLMSTVVTRLVASFCNLVTLLTVDKLGRRKLFIIGGFQMLVAEIAVGSILTTQLGEHGGMSESYAYIVIVLVCLFTAGFGCSWGPLPWLVTSEIFPLEIRSAGQSIFVAFGFSMMFVIAQVLLAMLCHFKSGIFFFFAGFVFVMTGFVYLFLQETRNVPLEKIDEIWRQHWFWKRMVLHE